MIRNATTAKLEKMLIEKTEEIRVCQTIMFSKDGSSRLVRNYPSQPTEGKLYNLRGLQKDRARILTELNMRLLKKDA
jgi:hypothetical protein